MPQDAAASGAKSDADSSKKGDKDQDAAASGDTDSQPDIEKIVAARVGQALKSKNVDELERKAREYDQLQESQKTEVQKLQDRIAAMETDKANWETERKQERVRSATVRAAAKLGYADPEDAYLLLKQDDMADDGSNVEKLLTDLLAAKPYLSSSRVNGSADGGQKGKPTDTKPTMNELIRAAAK